MEKKLKINFYSQHSHEVDLDWRKKSCGIACVKMVIDYCGVSKPQIMDLIEQGRYIGGYNPEYGWNHDSLVNILRNHGVSAYRQEFKSQNINPSEKNSKKSKYEDRLCSLGEHKIIQFIDKGAPSMISVEKGFIVGDSSHLILVIGYKKELDHITGFFYLDPDNQLEDDKKCEFMSLDRFHNFWRKLAIFTA